MIGFVYRLQQAGIPVSVQYLLEFCRALKKGLAPDFDRFFLLSRLIFVKRLEHYDTFEQVFASYFLGSGTAGKVIGWEELISSKPFQDWLRDQIESGALTPEMVHELDTEELLARFWETLLAQKGEHHGGATWVGTRGRSPYGHGGQAGGGVRVYGQSLYGTARKVIDNRQFINYSDKADLAAENLRQVLSSLKSLRPTGPETELDIEETIARTAKNAGEIELIFRRELRNRLKLMVFLDNGGYSMYPYVSLVRTVFTKIRDLFDDVRFYYFHNCIYGTVYRDQSRSEPEKWERLLAENKSTRLVIIGDANMAPAELMASFGSLDIYSNERKPGLEWLRELRAAFPVSVWLNPIHRERWRDESTTIHSIRRVFHMEDLTLSGIKNGVAYLNLQGQTFDRL
jgi:uncharacterized protein with von Willebrand factor type A (vWA) domain